MRNAVRTIRLEEDRITKLLDSLDAATETASESQTYKYRRKSVAIHLQQPGDAAANSYLVPTRSISERDLWFLHGGFVHPRTRCSVDLVTSNEGRNEVNGTVVACRYIEANVHEVRVRFDQRLDPSVYCSAAVSTRVLLVEDDQCIAKLAKFHLAQLNTVVECAEDGRMAVELARTNVYDVILMDMDLPVMNGFDATQELRKRGYTAIIVAVTGLTQPNDKERCLAAGCDHYLAKPYSREDLQTLLASIRRDPLFSVHHNDPTMAELINEFVSQLPFRIRQLEEAILAADTARLETLTRELKSEGAGYGFDVITKEAARAEAMVHAGAPIEDIRSGVEALIRLCLQARSSATLTGQARSSGTES